MDWHATRRDERTGIEPSIYYRNWQSDELVDENLIHPSLYCIVYERTIVFDAYNPSTSRICANVDGRWTDYFLSRRFSWLPTDFVISPDGKSAKALGYINNLNPYIHSEMNPVIELFVVSFVPLWERVLTESRADFSPASRIRTGGSAEEDEDYRDHENHTLQLPPIRPEFIPPWEPSPVILKDRTLQIITPEKPRYPCGSWHVEGMINEAIVSTGLNYYDEENISTSLLAFRMVVDEPGYLEHDDERAAQAIYGFERVDRLTQVLGSVVTKQSRCLAFSNCSQYQVQPFELSDKTKPGHRKIIALLLIDPALEEPRPSTSNAPPQQPDVMRFLLRDIVASLPADKTGRKKGIGKLPAELLDSIVDQADWLMTRREAEEFRLGLMDERKVMVKEDDEMMFAPEFNMCEH
ncbi:uncharacterized protein PHACADRAFT_212335 [Phanerochaete carnosa HHB-10118-sp]|uniref:DUF4246 domain-containing protein n=1 Tax=Phanerochaete carnosa (strain HHB-10118-sp) TaxID=650164 RepID=K5WN01_PHACS|nr:uncharacterized protein PHACADRAFT_212335 [Phanerochaete carnosa HHB-10118-sp]EKM51707.1 hypothetical protein PHACADRAFT_212335 [Phanerochaete carnosa HHB-10118-sp]